MFFLVLLSFLLSNMYNHFMEYSGSASYTYRTIGVILVVAFFIVLSLAAFNFDLSF
jgi:hypothetical protein